MNATNPVNEASDWLMRMQGENVPQAEVAAWLDWCNADPSNVEAFERAQSLYGRLQSVGEEARQDFLDLAEKKTDRQRRVWPLALAASLIAAIAVTAWRPWQTQIRGPEHREYQAARGGQRELLLADRSRVTLGSASALRSAYTEKLRAIELRRGEAYFQVAPDRLRPFVVAAGKVRVTAIGTAFNIRMTRERTVVSVTEGSVDVVSPDTAAPVHAQAGQQVVQALGVRGVTVASGDAAAAVAWRAGRLEYMVEPLGSVIDDVNRHAKHRIVIGDERLRHLVFTGTVFRDRIDEWALALDTVFPVRVSERADGALVMEPREPDFR